MIKETNIESETIDLVVFKVFFDNHFSQIKNFIYYKTSSAVLSEDLAQECFLRIWERRDSIKSETLLSYSYMIAKNLVIDHLKKKSSFLKFWKEPKKTNDFETPHYIMEENEYDIILQNAINCLSDKQRVVFLMNRIDELTYSQIAIRLELTEKAIEKRMMNALKQLKETINYKI